MRGIKMKIRICFFNYSWLIRIWQKKYLKIGEVNTHKSSLIKTEKNTHTFADFKKKTAKLTILDMYK